jgi:hypothetical protein
MESARGMGALKLTDVEGCAGRDRAVEPWVGCWWLAVR